ncbi:MAG: 3-oxoacyl-ACP reductase [Rhodocyclaceae bacterium]|nr:3-oxoacyl-ACP reductase [Rhodocyclaceae bacterium]
MSDYLVRLANDKTTANLIRALGLPAPVELRRGGTDGVAPLSGAVVLAGGGAGGFAQSAVKSALRALGAKPLEALPADESLRLNCVVLDATGCATPESLRLLYEAFNPVLRRLDRCARIVVLAAMPAEQADPVGAAVARGVEGFVRSLAKEVGKRGATANLIYVSRSAVDRLQGPLRFFCGDGCAYVTGQVLRVTGDAAAPSDLPAMQRLAGKVALVTGAARGIGAAVATRLAGEGAKVVCLDVAPARDPLYELALRIGGTPLVLDVTGAAGDLSEFLTGKFGGVDVVVHNAGITRDKTLANMKPELWDQVIAVNLQAIVAVDRELDTKGLIRDEGREICLSSISGVAGNYGQSNYAATKAALIGYVAARAPQLAARGITVNAIAPGFIETPMTAKIPMMMREVGRRLNSLSQGGQPEDVAEAICFLACPDAVGVTGQTLRVCGQSVVGA